MRARYTPLAELKQMHEEQSGKCRCGITLEVGPKWQRINFVVEHRIPLALGGLDVLSNKYLNCKECADIKTYGRSKATSYGSDRHAIDKTKRLRGERKPKLKKAWPKRHMQSGPSKWGKRSF